MGGRKIAKADKTMGTVGHVSMIDIDDPIWKEITAHRPSEKGCALTPDCVSCGGQMRKMRRTG
jgi:hypothetical protein